MSTAHASSVSPSSYTNTIFNQSAHMLSYDCFRDKTNKCVKNENMETVCNFSFLTGKFSVLICTYSVVVHQIFHFDPFFRLVSKE